jgi:hypothetical protein
VYDLKWRKSPVFKYHSLILWNLTLESVNVREVNRVRQSDDVVAFFGSQSIP